MKIRPGAVVEAALALAAGAALSVAADVDPNPRPINLDAAVWRAAYLVDPLLTGVALVAAAGLVVEAARRRGPAAWGVGRWTWALAGLYLALDGLVAAAQYGLFALQHKVPRPSARGLLGNLLLTWRFAYIQEILFILLAFLIASRLAGLPRDPAPDARERAGRLFLGLALAWGLAFRAMIWAGA